MNQEMIVAAVIAFIVAAALSFIIQQKRIKAMQEQHAGEVQTYRAQINASISREQYESETQTLSERSSNLESALSEAQSQLDNLRHQADEDKLALEQEYQSRIQQIEYDSSGKVQSVREQLAIVQDDLQALTDLLVTFERWHESLTQLMEHTAEMHHQNQEFFNIELVNGANQTGGAWYPQSYNLDSDSSLTDYTTDSNLTDYDSSE